MTQHADRRPHRVGPLGLRLTSEARAAVGGILVGLMLLLFVVIRLDPSGGSTSSGLTAVSVKTIPSVWVVRAGQTYGLIAERTGLSVEELEQLNPETDPGALTVGEQIRLRRQSK